MADLLAELDRAVPLQGMLGYLNFASGKPDPRFARQFNEAYGFLAAKGEAQPWTRLAELLPIRLAMLQAEGSPAFREITQAASVLRLGFGEVVPAYRQHHADLLWHLGEEDWYQPFFLVRVFEAVLLQGLPWEETERIIQGALTTLNDFVGHRPIAILETRPKGEPYEHERVRPIPLFIREAGVAWGRYHDLIAEALQILEEMDASLRQEAFLDLALLDELAVDPRAYDHGHPANRRPNYLFGEWDPHHLDHQGRYRRYVIRRITLDALLSRVEHGPAADRADLQFEAAAVLAGTILMASGTSGNSPQAHDSFTTLSTLMPRIARYRDAFYADLLERAGGARGDRLRQDASATRQPFGGARQHLNQFLAGHRAAQLQQRHLALLFAEMGYPDASRQAAAQIPAASVRLQSEMLSRLSSGQLLADRGRPAEAASLLTEVEDLLHRGIDCGALVDPWNILGFQALFPLFSSREDSLHDSRVDDLVQLMERLFDLYSRLASDAAAAGDEELSLRLRTELRRLAAWWDRFATSEVSDVRRVHGGEIVASTDHVAGALARWHARGERAADLSFWRDQLEGFQSAKAFALVVDALLRKADFRAAMALLINWLGQSGSVSLEDGEYSFSILSLRWMLGVGPLAARATPAVDVTELIRRFFDYMEANAEEYWQVPRLDVERETGAEVEEETPDLYEAAYADVTYRDSADDDQEGSVADGPEPVGEFDLEYDSERLTRRLRFLSALARLWQVAGRQIATADAAAPTAVPERAELIRSWLATARTNQRGLLALLDDLHAHPIPEPLGSFDSLVEYDRRRHVKEQLLTTAIGNCLDTGLAIGTLHGALGTLRPDVQFDQPETDRPHWGPLAIELERALLQGEAERVRALLPGFLNVFQDEPVLSMALADGGRPREILRVRTVQAVLRALLTSLPRLGLLRETYQVLRLAKAMEQAHPPQGRGVSEFNHLFQAAFQAVVEAVVRSPDAQQSGKAQDQGLVDLLEALTRPFLTLWVDHSQTLQLSSLETVASEEEWEELRRFIQAYGHDLFHAKFMTLSNLRGILHRGVGAYLDYLRDNPDPLHPIRLIDDLDQKVRRSTAERWLQLILSTLVENYEEYKDYNATTPQSDYGENLHLLLDFLRLKSGYERHAWRLRPLVQAHEVLAREGRADLAASWEEAFAKLTAELAAQYLQKLADLERTHGLRLRTVADLLQEQFIKSLAIDRLAALIEPAMEEARQDAGRKAFARLQKELEPLARQPTGVGLDVPQWLRRLETEVQRARGKRMAVAVLAEAFLQVPARPISLAEIHRQLEDWDRPLE